MVAVDPVDQAAQVVDGLGGPGRAGGGWPGTRAEVVDRDRRDSQPLAAADVDHGQVGRQVAQALGKRLVGGDHDHTVDRLLARPVKAPAGLIDLRVIVAELAMLTR